MNPMRLVLFVLVVATACGAEGPPRRDYTTFQLGDVRYGDPGPGDPYLCNRATGDGARQGDAPLDTQGFPGDLDDQRVAALAHIFPHATGVERRTGDVDYFVATESASTLGYAFVGQSYSWGGMLETYTGVDPDDATLRVELTHFGWGEWTWALTPAWMAQFQCMDLGRVDIAGRDWGPYPIDGVSGATITTQAVIESVWRALENYQAVDP